METSLTDNETRFVLGEMIKASSVDVSLLADFIRKNNVEQNWWHMQLPLGRTMQQCIGAVGQILPVHMPPLPTSTTLKRKSSSDQSDNPLKRPAVLAPIEHPLPPRMIQQIQPRPPHNGFAPTPATAVPGTPATPTTGKKRGRPSKADKEAQLRQSWTRPPSEFPPIIPAPAPTAAHLAPLNLAAPREYASPAGYEIASSVADPRTRLRGRLGTTDTSPTGTAQPVPSPVSTTPRAMPEQVEQLRQATLSPRDRGLLPPDSRSPHLPPQLPHATQSHPHTLPQPSVSGLVHQQPRHAPLYEPHRASEPPHTIDPIFPNRDRSQSVSSLMAKDASAAQSAPPPPPTTAPVSNRG